jgi:uncharacterized protein YjbI with pentapeptide repeats
MTVTREESWQKLVELKLVQGALPAEGIAIHQANLEYQLLEGLALPRTRLGRSRFHCVSFKGTDLQQSRLYFNVFLRVDFSGADLREADLRRSVFSQCNFAGADLRGADLRGSDFERTSFEGARLEGARLLKDPQPAVVAVLSPEQQQALAWAETDEVPHEG